MRSAFSTEPWPPTLSGNAKLSLQVSAAVKIPALRFDQHVPRAPSPDQLNVWTDFAEIDARPGVNVVTSRPRSTPDVRSDLRIQAKHLLSAANVI